MNDLLIDSKIEQVEAEIARLKQTALLTQITLSNMADAIELLAKRADIKENIQILRTQN